MTHAVAPIMPAESSTLSRLNRLLAFIEIDPGNLALRKDAIREAHDAGSWETARQLLDIGLQMHGDEPELLALSGFANLQAQRYPDAEQNLRAALGQGLERGEVRYNLAFALFMQRRYPDAVEQLGDAVCESVPLALLLRARCLHHVGRLQDAIADCKVLLAEAPDDPEANGLLSLLLYEQNEHEAATQHAQRALQREPKQREALLALASIQADARQTDAAQATFHALLEAHPDCGRAWLGAGLLQLSEMQIEEAKRDIEFAARYMPEHIGTWHVLAWIEMMLGDIGAAQTAFEKALAIDRNFGETHGGLAAICALRGREEEARTAIKRALRLDPQCLSARYAEMVLLERQGKRAEVQALLDEVMARPLNNSDVTYRELVAAQMRHLRMRAESRDGPRVYH